MINERVLAMLATYNSSEEEYCYREDTIEGGEVFD